MHTNMLYPLLHVDKYLVYWIADGRGTFWQQYSGFKSAKAESVSQLSLSLVKLGFRLCLPYFTRNPLYMDTDKYWEQESAGGLVD